MEASTVAGPALRRTGRAAAGVGGALLATGATGLAALRRPAKPLHPKGEAATGLIRRHGSSERTAVDWLDRPGENTVDVRLSRAIGLPRTVPDVHGMALRVHTGDGYGDILLATTGAGGVTRFLLTATRSPSTPMTTLLPYRTETGPVLLGVRLVAPDTYDLSWTRVRGPWHVFGVLHLSHHRGQDTDVSFDPIQHLLPGLQQYPIVRRLRAPAYVAARRSRGAAHGLPASSGA